MPLDPIDLIPQYVFWRDGCRTMAQNICKVLQLAGEPLTPERILAFVSTLPRELQELTSERWQEGYCGKCLERAVKNLPDADRESLETSLIGYFICYFPERGRCCQSMLIDAFIGILGGLLAEDGKAGSEGAS